MIEASSPLAAMQPPAFLGHCGFRPDGSSSYASLAATSFANNSFNFKDLSMKRSHIDYFNLKPVRGSSPTASLAADLSQNFHIDQRYANVMKQRYTKADTDRSLALSCQRRGGHCSPIPASLQGKMGTVSRRSRLSLARQTDTSSKSHHTSYSFVLTWRSGRNGYGYVTSAAQGTLRSGRNPTSIPHARAYTHGFTGVLHSLFHLS